MSLTPLLEQNEDAPINDTLSPLLPFTTFVICEITSTIHLSGYYTLTSNKMLATDHRRDTWLPVFPTDSIDPQHSFSLVLRYPIELDTCFSSLLRSGVAD